MIPRTDLQHAHVFGTDQVTAGEGRTRWVVAITLVMMIAEVLAGTIFGSMALLADGWHMGTHAAALGITMFAYAYARRHAKDSRFSFGTGKVCALGGFASAIGLAVAALLVLVESVSRFVEPVDIRFGEALVVAAVGLGVNLVSALLLGGHGHDHGHGHVDDHDHDHVDDHDHHKDQDHEHGTIHLDHNLRGAYLHVMADALTSVLAIGALLAGMFLDWKWLDPAIGVAGAVVIGRWAIGLARDTAAVLLDAEVPMAHRHALQEALESVPGSRVVDLHVWRIGPRHLALEATVTGATTNDSRRYHEALAGFPDIAHTTIEVHAE